MPKFKLITITNIIIAFTIFMYMVQNIIQNGNLYMGLNFYFLEGGLWWQPLSTMFAHGGIGHLLMNMFILYQFGNLVEMHRGKTTLLTLYFVGGLLTSFASFAFMVMVQLNHNLIGASGAICVILGYVAFVDTYQRKGIVVWVLLISFAPLLIGLPVAWYAHLIGFVFGWIIGMIKK